MFWPPRFIFRPNDNICKEQAVKYAKRLGFLTTTLAVFVPVEVDMNMAEMMIMATGGGGSPGYSIGQQEP